MYKVILDFWFKELRPEQWWIVDVELDNLIKNKFGYLHEQAIVAELWLWRKTPLGRLAEIIILDQFSRHIYRGQAGAFASDSMALTLAQEAVRIGAQDVMDTVQRQFLFLPYMHSESKKIHELAVKHFSEPGLEGNLEFEYKHKAIIDRFGRYPHRNAILGRISTTEEIEFLKRPDSKF